MLKILNLPTSDYHSWCMYRWESGRNKKMAFAEISLSRAVNCVAKVHETFWALWSWNSLFDREIRCISGWIYLNFCVKNKVNFTDFGFHSALGQRSGNDVTGLLWPSSWPKSSWSFFIPRFPSRVVSSGPGASTTLAARTTLNQRECNVRLKISSSPFVSEFPVLSASIAWARISCDFNPGGCRLLPSPESVSLHSFLGPSVTHVRGWKYADLPSTPGVISMTNAGSRFALEYLQSRLFYLDTSFSGPSVSRIRMAARLWMESAVDSLPTKPVPLTAAYPVPDAKHI
jgi:hypothetical protein